MQQACIKLWSSQRDGDGEGDGEGGESEHQHEHGGWKCRCVSSPRHGGSSRYGRAMLKLQKMSGC